MSDWPKRVHLDIGDARLVLAAANRLPHPSDALTDAMAEMDAAIRRSEAGELVSWWVQRSSPRAG